MLQIIYDNEPSLIMKIVRKMEPIGYVRTRRTCRAFDEFCEEQRHQIGIYPRQRSEISLTASTKMFYYVNGFGPDDQDFSEEEQHPTVLLNYGNMFWESNLEMEMIKENISRLRSAISGFNFHEYSFAEDFEDRDIFEEALGYFLEVIKDIRPSTLTSDVETTFSLLKKTSRWKLKSLELDPYVELEGILNSPLIKKLEKFSCFLSEFEGNYNFFDLIENKKSGAIEITFKDAQKIVPRFFQKWKKGQLQLENFKLYTEWERDSRFDVASHLEEEFYLGCTNIWNPEYFIEKEDQRNEIKIEFWIFEQENGQLVLVSQVRNEDLQRTQLYLYNIDCLGDALMIIIYESISQLDDQYEMVERIVDEVSYTQHYYSGGWTETGPNDEEEYDMGPREYEILNGV